MSETESCNISQTAEPERNEFKKPILIGRVGKLPKKANNEVQITSAVHEEKTVQKTVDESVSEVSLPQVSQKDAITLPYREPKWSGVAPEGFNYALEVLKSGVIVEKIDLSKRPYYIFGRLDNCDVKMAHPTISRYHSILQYKAFAEAGEPPSGWYLYDLESTHGTFVNKEKLKGLHYTRVRVGHQIKFGNSSRVYIMVGPDFDCDNESDLSVTEIKKRAEDMKLQREKLLKEALEIRERERLENERKKEEQGIDWGMGEDAEEEPDLAENPFASTANEELYLDDPKKTLRGYFEREGHELNYDCEERGVGQFMCRVELPMDDSRGRPVVAEVIHRGKKKEAVVACALEACRILDRAGLLRQAKHESRRRKERDWSADDYYDSDEDTFLDRTGSVERKRKLRMQKHGTSEKDRDKPLTYDDLVKQIEDIEKKILSEEKCLERLRATAKSANEITTDNDALDEFMSSLGKQGQSMANKAEISKTKMSIQKLKSELSKVHRLADLARPAHLPPLVKKSEPKMAVKVSNSVVFGKRIRLKEEVEKRPKIREVVKKEEEEFVEEMDSDEEESDTKNIEHFNNDLKIKKVCNNSNLSRSKIDDEKDNQENKDNKVEEKKTYGPMRPPENYVIPENYFDQESSRDLPEIIEE